MFDLYLQKNKGINGSWMCIISAHSIASFNLFLFGIKETLTTDLLNGKEIEFPKS